MLRNAILNLIAKCASKTFHYSYAGYCFFLFYQEELPAEALKAKAEH